MLFKVQRSLSAGALTAPLLCRVQLNGQTVGWKVRECFRNKIAFSPALGVP
jgi:hypothetical protein